MHTPNLSAVHHPPLVRPTSLDLFFSVLSFDHHGRRSFPLPIFCRLSPRSQPRYPYLFLRPFPSPFFPRGRLSISHLSLFLSPPPHLLSDNASFPYCTVQRKGRETNKSVKDGSRHEISPRLPIPLAQAFLFSASRLFVTGLTLNL